MQVTIVKKTEVPLLSRINVEADVHYSGPTPKRQELKDKLAGVLGVKPSLVTVQKIDVRYGSTQARVSAMQFFNEESAKTFSPAHLAIRGQKKAEGEEAAPKKEAKAEKKK